jgi:hypothetical protein
MLLRRYRSREDGFFTLMYSYNRLMTILGVLFPIASKKIQRIWKNLGYTAELRAIDTRYEVIYTKFSSGQVVFVTVLEANRGYFLRGNWENLTGYIRGVAQDLDCVYYIPGHFHDENGWLHCICNHTEWS